MCWPEEEALMYEQSMKHISLKNSCHPLCRTHFSGGSRGGSMGSMEPPLLKDCLRKYYAQMYTYTTFTLELCTSASTVAITHMCQLLYQEFDMRMAHVHIYTTRSMWQQRVKEAYSCIAPSAARDGDMLSVWEWLFFGALHTALQPLQPEAESRFLILWGSNTTTRFSSRSSNFCNFTPRIYQKRPLHFVHYQASPAVQGWPGNGD